MPRRVAVALLAPPVWAPPGVDLAAWRLALAEDVLDVFATMVEVEAAVAVQEADADLLGRIGWPGLRGYVVPALDVATVFAAVAADGYDQAVLLAGDAPDLPGMLIAKLLRPLTTRPVAAAPAIGAGPPTPEEADHHDAVVREEALASGQPVDERALRTDTSGVGEFVNGEFVGDEFVNGEFVNGEFVRGEFVRGEFMGGDATDDAGGTGGARTDPAGTGGAETAGTVGAGAAGAGASGTGAVGTGRAGTGAAGAGAVGTGTEAARGLLGLAATIPAAGWLPRAGLDDLTPQSLRRLASAVTDVAPAPGWHRLRSPADLARLDPRLEGWDATRALLSARPNRAS
jgi:hypothetical protein